MKITPALKGVITASGMIAIALITYYSGMPADSYFQYLVYAIYALGIVWTIITFRNSGNYTGKFWDNFNQGFRCFIVVTLIMVIFTAVFSKMHPAFAEESAKLYKEEMLKSNSKTPDEIEIAVKRYKNGYTTMLVYSAIFGYLIIGSIITAITAVLSIRRS